jgi:hypothetical protein
MSCEIALHIAIATSSGNRLDFAGRLAIMDKIPTGARQVIQALVGLADPRTPTRRTSSVN